MEGLPLRILPNNHPQRLSPVGLINSFDQMSHLQILPFKMQSWIYIVERDTSDIQYWRFQEQKDNFTKIKNQTQDKLFI